MTGDGMTHDNASKQAATPESRTGAKGEAQPEESSSLTPAALTQRADLNSRTQHPEPTAADIKLLQRTIGNRAIQRYLGMGKRSKGSKPPASTKPAAPTNLPALPNVPAENIHTIPLASNFENTLLSHAQIPHKIGMAGYRPYIRKNMPSVPDPANAPATTPGTSAPAPTLTLEEKRAEILKPIMDHYRDYQASRSLANLISLYDFVKHWLATRWDNTELREVGMRVPPVREALEALTKTIEQKVRIETGRIGIDAKEAETFDKERKKKASGKTIAFFDDVGAPKEFYSKLSSKKIKLFENLYLALSGKKPAAVPALIAQIGEHKIPGWLLIKGLFLTRFPDVAGIDHLQDPGYEASAAIKQSAYGSGSNPGISPEQTAEEDYVNDNPDLKKRMQSNLGGLRHGKALTPAEQEALTSYTAANYMAMNGTLRRNDLSAPDPESQKGKNAIRTNAKINVLASALNKLPVHQGIAYRMQDSFGDFDAAVKAGSMYTDLAFMSASKTLQGAEYGGGSGGGASAGALQVYMLIHTKNARDVTILSGIPRETELLFQPGTRFYVKAIWQHVDGRVPKDAPMEAQMILHRQGETKTVLKQDRVGIYHGKVRIVQLVET
jgi:hypothetical protein